MNVLLWRKELTFLIQYPQHCGETRNIVYRNYSSVDFNIEFISAT